MLSSETCNSHKHAFCCILIAKQGGRSYFKGEKQDTCSQRTSERRGRGRIFIFLLISRLCEMSLDSLLKQARGSYTHLMPLAASLGLCFPPTTRAGTPQWKHSSRTQALGMPNCQSQHQPAAATSLLFTSLAPVHPGCPLLAPT